MHFLDWIIFVGYFLALIGIAFYSRISKSMEEFAVGSRSIPAGVIFATLSATFIGPGYTMGLANKAGSDGYVWLFIFLAFSLQTIFVGYYLAPKLNKFNGAYTIGDIMGLRYGKNVKIITGVISVAVTTGIFGIFVKAYGDIIHYATGADFLSGAILSTVFVVAYSTYGGIKSVILTDAFQFIILAIFVPLILFFIQFNVGFDKSFSDIPPNLLTLSDKFPIQTLLGLFISFLLGETLMPPYTNRALMAKDHFDAKKGFLWAGIFSIGWFIVCSSIGVLGAGQISNSQNLYLDSMNKFLPIGFYGFSVIAIISIVMSSQSSLLNSAAVSLNNDIIASFSNKVTDSRMGLHSSKILNLITGILATIFALQIPSLVDALLYCYTLWAPTIVLPFIIAIFKDDVKPSSGLWAITIGGAVTGIWEWGLNIPYQIPSLVVGVAANQIIFWSIHYLIKNDKRNK